MSYRGQILLGFGLGVYVKDHTAAEVPEARDRWISGLSKKDIFR